MKPKYKIGQEVWFIDLFRLRKERVIGVLEGHDSKVYDLHNVCGLTNEKELYPDKESLKQHLLKQLEEL